MSERSIGDLDTPALLIDLDRLESNLVRWQRYCDETGLVNRPHVKTHKVVEIARRQVGLGAHGLTCQKLGEAEVIADAGIEDILVPYNLVGERKLTRLAALLSRARVSVSVDDAALLPGLACAAERAGRELRVHIECDTGLQRAGVQSPEEAVRLAAETERTEGLRFAGFVTYPALPGAREFLDAASAGARRQGLTVESASAGGTPTMWQAAELRPTVTEYRVGTYVYHDRNTVAAGAAKLDDVALTVLATVVSRPARDRAIIDAGSKALAYDPGPDDGHGLILDAPDSPVAAISEEHGHLRVGPGDRLDVGQRVRVVPNHACVVSNLFDEVYATRGQDVLDRWRVAARGRSQ